MSYVIRLSPGVRGDISRLVAFLAERDPDAALRARDRLLAALRSLIELPGRGRLVTEALRELPVAFGRYGYAIRYEVYDDVVFIVRIFHARERR